MPMISGTSRPGAAASELRGLEGWLLIVGLWLFVTPFLLLKTIVENAVVFEDGTWGDLTDPGSPVYHPLWAPLLIGDVVLNVLLLAGSVIALWLFFRKRRTF